MLEVCLELLSYWTTRFSVRILPSLLGSKLFSKISTDWSAFILPSISGSCSTLSQFIQPYIMMFLPSNLTESQFPLSIISSPICFHIHHYLYNPSLFILFLSDKILLLPVLHSPLLVLQSKGQVLLPGMCSEQWLVFSIAALNECLIRRFLTVYERTISWIIVLTCFRAWTAFAAILVVVYLATEHWA